MRNLKSLNCISDPNPILQSKNEFGSWAQSVEYEPRLEDDGKTLACSLAAASKGAADSITMRMLINAAKKDLVEQEHVTSAGKVQFYFHDQDVTKKPATVLVKKTRSTRQSACIALFLFV